MAKRTKKCKRMSVKGIFNGVQYTKVITPTSVKWVSPQSKFNRTIFPIFQAENKNLREKGQIEWTWKEYKEAYLYHFGTRAEKNLFVK